MRTVIRSAVHLGVVASLLLAFEQAPFQHVHETDRHHDHAHGFAHIHWGTLLHAGQVIHAEDYEFDARMVDWLADDTTSSMRFAPGPPELIVAPQMVLVTEVVPSGETHNHDPPFLAPLGQRGPPA